MKKLLATFMRIIFILMLILVMIPSFIILILNYDKSRIR
ncbi:hypothetical protein KGNDJEFE_01225 [Peptacetobacter hiranonis]|nr:hypothetical protein KGNDJEFE_01225 [Peptacetobacter hiranonis]